MDKDEATKTLDRLVTLMDACSVIHTNLLFPMLKPDTHGYNMGKKYAKVWTISGGQQMVCFFVEIETGEVWKADGWKSPTRNFPRGTVLTDQGLNDLTLGKMTPAGYYYAAF